MGIPTTPKELSKILIYEGIVDTKMLYDLNLNMDWVQQQLKMQNVSDIRTVYIGLLTPDHELYIN